MLYLPMRWMTFIVSFASTLLLPTSAHAMLRISEVLWAGSPVSNTDEWVEFIAIGEGDVSGWRLASVGNGGEETMVTFPPGFLVGTDQILIVSNYDAEKSVLAAEPDIVTTAVSLSNSALLLRLYDASGALMDEIGDGGKPFAGSTGDVRASMERLDLLAPGTDPENWVTAVTSLNIDSGALVLATPGTTTPQPHPSPGAGAGPIATPSSSPNPNPNSILISEILANPIGRDDEEWIELANASDKSTDLVGLSLAVKNATFSFATGTVLLPGENRSFRKSLTGIGLPNGGADVRLLQGENVIDELTYSETGEEVSYGRIEGGERPFCVTTENAPNTVTEFPVDIGLQSGQRKGTGKVTLNVEAVTKQGSLDSAVCHFTFGDGFEWKSCNPPSHTYDVLGKYTLMLRVDTVCGETIEREVAIVVEEETEQPTTRKLVTLSSVEGSLRSSPTSSKHSSPKTSSSHTSSRSLLSHSSRSSRSSRTSKRSTSNVTVLPIRYRNILPRSSSSSSISAPLQDLMENVVTVIPEPEPITPLWPYLTRTLITLSLLTPAAFLLRR